MCLEQRIESNAEYVTQSGFSVSIDESSNTVAIEHDSGDDDLSIHLVGHYGAKFISDSKEEHSKLSESEMPIETVWLAKAKGYLDCLDEMPICA